MRKDIESRLKDMKRRIGIDQFSLDTECKNQPLLYEEVGELAIEEKAEAKRAKERLDYKRAELEMAIRSSPEKYGLVKATEGAISAKVILQDEYQKALKSYIDQQEVADALGILLVSVEQRKAMLRDLVSLYIYNYYSGTDLGKDKKDVANLDEQRIMQYKQDRARRREVNGKEERDKHD